MKTTSKSTKKINYELDTHSPYPNKKFPADLILVVSLLLLFLAAATLRLQYSTSKNYDTFFPNTTPHIKKPIKDCSRKESSVQPPRNLMHNMTDDELLRRASKSTRREGHHCKRVAFMFLTRGNLPLLPLWERFFKGHGGLFSVYVHTVPGYELHVPRDSAFYARQIPSKEVQWGTTTLLDAERRILANSLLDISNERFVLLSESCIPIFNFTTIYTYLTSSPYSFLDSSEKNSAIYLYNPQMDPNVTPQQWRKGSNWFEVTRELATSIAGETKIYTLFKTYCHWAFPDEHYLPTYATMFHGSMLANRSVTWVDWSRGTGAHPASYGGENIKDGFIESIRRSNDRYVCNVSASSACFLFARKFAPSALEPLLKLSSTVLGFDS